VTVKPRQGAAPSKTGAAPRKSAPVAPRGPLTILLYSLPPSLNHAYKNTTMKTRTGKVYTGRRLTADAQAWRDAATLEMRSAANERGWEVPSKTPLSVEILYQMPTLYRADLDGMMKVLLDAMKDAIGVDDRYIVDLHPRKIKGPEAVRIDVRAIE
jgi:Holliday junction resolvase RusA-like endonuclease